MVAEHQMSERHACALVGLSRDTYRHVGKTSALNMELREQIVQTAHARRRWGYRMIHDVLRPHYPGINHKRVYRIYTAEGLSIRKRKKTKRIGVRVPLVAAMAVAAVLSGNRNYEGRIHGQVKASYLASPPLCVAYALVGTVLCDLSTDSLGTGHDGQPVYLKDIWPTNAEIAALVASSVASDQFEHEYGRIFEGDDK